MAKNYIKGSYRSYAIPGTNDKKIVASISVSDLQKIANEKGFASIVIQERRETDAFGNTHYAFENDYKPKEKSDSQIGKPSRAAGKLSAPTFTEDLGDNPFA